MQIKQTFFCLAMLGLFSLSLTACRQPMGQMMEGQDQSSQMPMDQAGHNMAEMDLGPKDEHFDLRFIDGMILHHQGAIAMAETALKQSSRDEIKQLAEAIITAQQTEIARMQDWRKTWYAEVDDKPMMYHADAKHMMPMSESMRENMMMNVDLGEADAEFDQRFINAMIPHHEGAVVMAQQVLERSDRPELLELAKEIMATQQQEIDQMKQWREAWYEK